MELLPSSSGKVIKKTTIESLWKCSKGHTANEETFIQGNLLKFGNNSMVFEPRPVFPPPLSQPNIMVVSAFQIGAVKKTGFPPHLTPTPQLTGQRVIL